MQIRLRLFVLQLLMHLIEALTERAGTAARPLQFDTFVHSASRYIKA